MLSFDLLLRGFTGLWNNLVLAGPCRQPCKKHRRGLTLSCNRKCKRQSWKKCTHVKTFRALEGNHRNTMVKWRNFGKIGKAARFSALMKTKLNGWALNCRCGPSSYSTEQHRTVRNNTEQYRTTHCKLSAKTLLSTIQTIATAWSQYNNASYCLPFTQSSIETGELGSLEDSCLTYRQLN